MPAFTDLSGRRFGRLLVVTEHRVRSRHGRIRWTCLCACGNRIVCLGYTLQSGATKSCGCFRRQVTRRTRKTHGDCASAEYKTWTGIKKRCLNAHAVGYSNYGGRGVRVCSRWIESYEAFLADMGRRPSPQHSIDRINNDGNYEPGNCRWATRKEQYHNRRPRNEWKKAA